MSDEKQSFLDDVKKSLGDLQTKLEALKVQASLGKMEARDRIESTTQDLRSKADRLQQKLEGAKETSGAAWGEMREGIAKAWDELKTGLSKARAELGD